jgi:uncharacterized protein (TIGR03067 family)
MFIVPLLSIALFADAPKVAPDKDALAKLQGKWQQSREEHGGKSVPAKALVGTTLEIAGVQATQRDGDDSNEGTKITGLDPKAKPASIDLEITKGDDKGKTVAGIWKLDGDKLSICVAEPGKARPTEFAGKEGTGHTLLVFEKLKKK